jgi:hypothetical protein
MLIGLNGVPSWLCNVCGYIWPQCETYLHGGTLRCALCHTHAWSCPVPDDPETELPGA